MKKNILFGIIVGLVIYCVASICYIREPVLLIFSTVTAVIALFIVTVMLECEIRKERYRDREEKKRRLE
tara:strand:- start:879 stop:1085 length:207 start_codon:yes stop_codon:yes gene_type:complete